MRPRVFIGYDDREHLAYRACVRSLHAHCSEAIVNPVSRNLLGALYQRPTTRRDGTLFDEISKAPMATDFSIARFFVPYIAADEFAVYCDGDFLWRSDVRELFALADPNFAVQVVQHIHDAAPGQKMDGQVQTSYARKNWSSLMLWNCDHPGARHLTPEVLNRETGLYLHQLQWLPGDWIGALPEKWNWLEGISNPSIEPAAVHYTRGTPNMQGYEMSAFADEWRKYASKEGEGS